MFVMNRYSAKFLLMASFTAVLLSSQLAFASSGGRNGYSGATGLDCTVCHSAGADVPTVTIDGPMELKPGQTALYQLIIEGGPGAAGGTNIAVGDNLGALASTEDNLNIYEFSPGMPSTELTHSSPKAPDADGKIIFDFSWTAPTDEQTATIYAAGNSINLNGNMIGDGVATTTFDVTVTNTPTAVLSSNAQTSSATALPAMMALLAVGGLTVATRKRS